MIHVRTRVFHIQFFSAGNRSPEQAESGGMLIESAIIAALISVIAVVGIADLGASLSERFSSTETLVNNQPLPEEPQEYGRTGGFFPDDEIPDTRTGGFEPRPEDLGDLKD